MDQSPLTTPKDPKRIQPPVRLSQSKLWAFQRRFFEYMGPKAWDKGEVPYYITGNAFIGHQYAQLVAQYIKDLIQEDPSLRSQPFYVVELGAGNGLFGFYFLQGLARLKQHAQHALDNVTYILTDVAQKNLDFCKQCQSFAPYFESKQLDVALFDIEKDKDFYLQTQNQFLSKLSLKTPVLLIANYTFDCTVQDAFKKKSDGLYEVQMGLRSRYDRFDHTRCQELDELRFDFEDKKIDISSYYEHPILNALLQEYNDFLRPNDTFLLPLSAFVFLDNMRQGFKNGFFLICGDKGLCHQEEIHTYKSYKLAFDGCYSFIVNFHAIHRFLSLQSGSGVLSSNSGNDFKVVCFAMDQTLDHLQNFHLTYQNTCEHFGPFEYCALREEVLANSFRFSMSGLLAFLKLSQCDPKAFVDIHKGILEHLSLTRLDLKEQALRLVEQVESQIFSINLGYDPYNVLGILFLHLKEPARAIEAFKQSLSFFGDHTIPYFNLGLAYEQLKHQEIALSNYRKALKFDPKNKEAKEKITQLTRNPIWSIIRPALKAVLIIGSLVGLYFVL